MKRIYLRGAAALLSVLLAGQVVPLSALGASPLEGGVTINAETFPDSTFRSWLPNSANLNGAGTDAYLTVEELASIRQINVSGLRISSLEGIELFPALETLSCKDNSLSSLDVSQNKNLTYLQCSFNQISSLDVSGLDKLVALYCESNHMTSLTLSGATALEIIYCRNNDLPKVDFSTNTSLKFIETFDNRLSSVDLSMLKELEFVHLDHNLLTELDLSGNTSLSPIGSGFVARNNFLNTLTLPVKADLMVDPDVYFEQDPKEGYDRVEWYSDPDHSDKITGAVQAQGQTLYAKWLPNDYTIYFSANGGSGSMSSQGGVWGQELSLNANQFTRVGYTFAGWKKTYGSSAPIYADQQKVTNLGGIYQGQQVTLYAQWEANKYTIAFDTNGGNGMLAPLECTYDQNKQLTPVNDESGPTLTHPNGREFAGWATEPGGKVRYQNGDTVRNLTSEAGGTVTLYAVWREPVSDQYLKDLEKAFAAYPSGDYTAQDWEALTQTYTTAAANILSADNEDTMKHLYDQAVADMRGVATAQERANQAVSAWKSAHPVVNQTAGGVVTEEAASDLRQKVQNALVGLTADLVRSSTGLTRPADQERVLAMALEQTASDFQDLNALGLAAAWADGLDGLSTRDPSEVTSDWYSTYDQACTGAEAHRSNLSTTLLSALETRRDLAGQKAQAVMQLQSSYESYDLSRYTEENQNQLASIWSDGTTAIQQAVSSSAVTSALSGAQNQLKAVPTKDEPQQPGGGSTGGGGGAGGTGGGGTAPEPSTPPIETVPPTQPPVETTVTDPITGASAVVTTGSNGVSAQISHPTPGKPAVLTIPAQAGPSTVAVLVGEDGTRTVLPWAVASADGLKLMVSQSCRVELEERDASFSDVAAQAWYSDAVTFTSSRGLFSGVSGGRFAPEQTMTRSMLASVLYRMDGAPKVSNDAPFSDVPAGRWDSAAVQWAAQSGIVSGTGANRFSPEAPITREALVTILYRYANQAGLSTDQRSSLDFTDAGSISPWAEEAVNWACESGILQGSNNQLRPGSSASRAEAASILMRFTDLVVRSVQGR